MKTAKINNTRLHLREEKDGTGLLVINASHVLYLDKIGTDFVKHYLRYSLKKPLVGSVRDNVVLRMMTKYKVGRKKAGQDYDRLMDSIWGIIAGNTCPFTTFDVKVKVPEFGELKAPLRIDLALTYRCNNNCGHCYAGGPRNTKELSTAEWKTIIDKAHKFEVPNVVFTGGESLMRDDLEELIAHAESLGIVTGLITNGRLLTKERVASLDKAGLDYVQITIESQDPKIHNAMCKSETFDETVAGIKNAVKRDLHHHEHHHHAGQQGHHRRPGVLPAQAGTETVRHERDDPGGPGHRSGGRHLRRAQSAAAPDHRQSQQPRHGVHLVHPDQVPQAEPGGDGAGRESLLRGTHYAGSRAGRQRHPLPVVLQAHRQCADGRVPADLGDRPGEEAPRAQVRKREMLQLHPVPTVRRRLST